MVVTKKKTHIHIIQLDNFKIFLYFLKDHHAAALKCGRMVWFSPGISDLVGYQRRNDTNIWTFPGTSDMDILFDCQSRSVPLLLMGFVQLEGCNVKKQHRMYHGFNK